MELSVMTRFVHPPARELELTAILAALADPVRLRIVMRLADTKTALTCSEAAPFPKMAKSTLSHHFRSLREAGLIRTEKRGVEHHNQLRRKEIDERFPGLLKKIIKLGKAEASPKKG